MITANIALIGRKNSSVTYISISIAGSTIAHKMYLYTVYGGKAMANYPQELAQDAVCQSHTGHMTGLWFLPSPAFKAEYK